MPYGRESAGKGGHSDFVKNPDVVAFLGECDYMRPPSDEEALRLGQSFLPAPCGEVLLPRHVIASDASKSDTPISERLPSTQVGFLKISHVLINMTKYAGLVDPQNRFVDPFKVSEIHRDAHPLTFTMPGSNIRYKGASCVKDGFRAALFDQLSRVTSDGGRRSAAQVLLDLEDGGAIELGKCPACGDSTRKYHFSGRTLVHECSRCRSPIYVTDFLRLHEGISDFGDNSAAMTRMMNALEHLMIAAFILEVERGDVVRLADLTFVLDGPLAIFGEPAKLSQRLQKLIYRINAELSDRGLRSMLVLGLQKTGGLMDHAKLIERHLPAGTLRVVDDGYRNEYVTGGELPAVNFGNETYYGQDFLFKTEKGRIFNFAIPYPFADKSSPGANQSFAEAKVELVRYGHLVQQACDLIRHFEMDLYDSAIVPVALAHRHASISLMPGGKVLDLMVRSALKP